jgi:hypothetical protein
MDENNIFIDSFVFDTYKSILDYNSFNNKEKYNVYLITIDNIKYLDSPHIPVGSIEFTHEYFKLANIEIPKPLNVPINLRKYCTRNIFDISKSELIKNKDKYNDYYIKSNEAYKDFEINKVKYFDVNISKCENYFISSQIEPEIVSEFRCFILSDRIISINNYIGDCIGLNNKHILIIKEIIKQIKNLRAYTIDFAILENNELEIIELHHGYSCGNYGFKGDKYLSFLINGINQLKYNKNI